MQTARRSGATDRSEGGGRPPRSGRTDLQGGVCCRRHRGNPDRSRHRHRPLRTETGANLSWNSPRPSPPSTACEFDGLQAYEGHARLRQRSDRTNPTGPGSLRKGPRNTPASRTKRNRGADSQRRLVVDLSNHRRSIDGVNEIQAGSYATMDWRYAEMLPDFEVALSVLARVISKRPGVAVLDVGLKGAGCEFGSPRIKDHPVVEIPHFVSEEHCIVRNAPSWKIGKTVQLLPSHACTTCKHSIAGSSSTRTATSSTSGPSKARGKSPDKSTLSEHERIQPATLLTGQDADPGRDPTAQQAA